MKYPKVRYRSNDVKLCEFAPKTMLQAEGFARIPCNFKVVKKEYKPQKSSIMSSKESKSQKHGNESQHHTHTDREGRTFQQDAGSDTPSGRMSDYTESNQTRSEENHKRGSGSTSHQAEGNFGVHENDRERSTQSNHPSQGSGAEFGGMSNQNQARNQFQAESHHDQNRQQGQHHQQEQQQHHNQHDNDSGLRQTSQHHQNHQNPTHQGGFQDLTQGSQNQSHQTGRDSSLNQTQGSHNSDFSSRSQSESPTNSSRTNQDENQRNQDPTLNDQDRPR